MIPVPEAVATGTPEGAAAAFVGAAAASIVGAASETPQGAAILCSSSSPSVSELEYNNRLI